MNSIESTGVLSQFSRPASRFMHARGEAALLLTVNARGTPDPLHRDRQTEKVRSASVKKAK